ncbi:formate dehydrogenase accessory sulfurtransferase FdhD [Gayadomonas joobiniege]|uniref:formate dehydrogenase accessory sulfurtransferase FdhD n=1 Tax=Gayadomonas joobiniege TaxID=1234606 RepID=UPI0003654F74|nr:formate dehydrogenase accessory sulfurtransferase FdhD [Gayadomonas joobiniege]
MSADHPSLAQLTEEVAAAITINGINYAVMMISPFQLENFAIGFLYHEGLLTRLYDLHEFEVISDGDFIELQVTLSQRSFSAFKQTKRSLKGTSGCGICGKQALTYAFPKLPLVKPAPAPDQALLLGLRDKFSKRHQAAHNGAAIHAAAVVNKQGEFDFFQQDIGRHNALDKVTGAMLLAKNSPVTRTVLISSRCSSELVQKAIKSGYGNLISLASPSKMAVKMAAAHQLNLIHIGRQNTINYYLWQDLNHAKT